MTTLEIQSMLAEAKFPQFVFAGKLPVDVIRVSPRTILISSEILSKSSNEIYKIISEVANSKTILLPSKYAALYKPNPRQDQGKWFTAPEGFKICSLCRRSLPLERFNKSSAESDRKQKRCKDCNHKKHSRFVIQEA